MILFTYFEIKWVELADYKEVSNWRVLAYLINLLREPWDSTLTDVYRDICPSQPFRVYLLPWRLARELVFKNVVACYYLFPFQYMNYVACLFF